MTRHTGDSRSLAESTERCARDAEQPLGPVAAAIAEYEAVTRASGHGLARADAPGPAGEGGGAEIAGERPDRPAPGLYFNGVADSALRRALARLRRRPDPAVRAVADQLAAEAAAALLALAARADAADPVMRERRAAQQRRAERLRAQLDRPRPARGSR